MFDTALTRALNIDVPIVQAPIANLTCPELVAAVSNAGAVAAWEDAGSPATDRPGEGEAVARLPDGSEALRYSDYEPAAGMEGEVEALAHYAGQSAGLVTTVQPAGDIVREIAGESVQAGQAVRDALAGGGASGQR